MAGSFEKEGDFVDDKIEQIDKYKIEEKYTASLVPIIKKEDYDFYATKLKHFCPSAIEKPTKLELSKIFSNKGMRFYNAPLGDNILGKTYFANDKATVYTDIDSGEIGIINVTLGTILINFDRLSNRGEGTIRNTIVHETEHWFIHSNYFKLQFLLNEKLTCAVYYRCKSPDYTEEIE